MVQSVISAYVLDDSMNMDRQWSLRDMCTWANDLGQNNRQFGHNYLGMDSGIYIGHSLNSVRNHYSSCIRGDNHCMDLRSIRASIDKNRCHYIQCIRHLNHMDLVYMVAEFQWDSQLKNDIFKIILILDPVNDQCF